MSSYKTFAIAGAGTVGKYILQNLVKAKEEGKIDSVVVFTRSAEGNPEANALGVKSVQVDYTSVPALTTALKGVDVLISALGPFGLGLQGDIATAAKEAGVKLFVPAEYGAPAIDMGGIKSTLRRKFESLGLPFTIFFVGVFMHSFFSPALSVDLPGGKVTVGGKAHNPITWTTVKDIGAYIAHCLTTLPPAKLEGATILIEGDRAGIKEVIAEYEKRTGKKVEITYRTLEGLKASAAANPFDFPSLLWLTVEDNQGVIGAPDEVNLYKFPGWEPTKAIDFILGESA
ncbi:NADP-binding protein [Dacryopinax primogenitus]|uniref:NADP-binding protein n=1 Tax=Dacryopinax primogenitus (strain DJM 731) TaxID=1858805 RepID=M5FUM9_DACPD|nr:NADP-binding protein [Dacryopinax primogenitus]EJU01466.1 NADP-binding protein [Dacryopinax primogenitus]